MANNIISRRNFIKRTGLTGAGLYVGFSLFHNCTTADNEKEVKPPLITLRNGLPEKNAMSGITDFLHIHPDGNIFINLTKHEMGQGVSTGLSAILAEELEADWSKINIIYADPIPGISNTTGGSTSIKIHWELLRKVGAYVKKMLIETASNEWSVHPDNCYAENNFVYQMGSNKKLEYGQLANKVIVPENYMEVMKNTPLKFRSKFKLIGKGLKSKIIPDMITGTHPYSMDIFFPGMKYAAIERSPVFTAVLESFDATETLAINGVEKVVPIKGVRLDSATHIRDGVAVIATSTWAAFQGKKALKIKWKSSEREKINHTTFLKDCYERLSSKPGTELFSFGDKPVKEKDTDQEFSRTYEFPYQHHACMEPLNATAHFKDNSCEIWVGTQSADKIITNVENHLGIEKEKIKVNCYPSGGGFGLRYSAVYGLEALLVSKACNGALIKMCYSREDDIKCDYLNPFEINKHSVKIRNGKVISWEIKNVIIEDWGGLLGWLFYNIPYRRGVEIRVKGFTQVGAWRSVMANAEGFSTECFIDELAHKLSRDPLEFRLSLLPEDTVIAFNHEHKCTINRLRGALELVAKTADWGKSMPDNSGQGIAVYPYMHGNGYAAAVAELSIVNAELSIDKITIAIDCGLAVNPELIRQQVEGGVIWAISAMLYGGTEYKDGVIQRSNFHDNKVARMHEIPHIEVLICKNDETRPWGVGEVAGPVTYPAVCNAIYAATGRRIRKLPLHL